MDKGGKCIYVEEMGNEDVGRVGETDENRLFGSRAGKTDRQLKSPQTVVGSSKPKNPSLPPIDGYYTASFLGSAGILPPMNKLVE